MIQFDIGALFIWTEWLTKNLENLEINFWSLPEKDKCYLVLIAKRWLFSLVYVPWKEDSGSASRVIFPAVNHPDTLWDFRRSQCVCWPSGSSGYWGWTFLRIPNIESELCFPQSKVAKKHFFFPICFGPKFGTNPFFSPPENLVAEKNRWRFHFVSVWRATPQEYFNAMQVGIDGREQWCAGRVGVFFFWNLAGKRCFTVSPDIWRCNHWRFTLNICKFHQASKQNHKVFLFFGVIL